jgi:hypothetical protein
MSPCRRRARDEWEAAKQRVKKLEQELEAGRQARVRLLEGAQQQQQQQHAAAATAAATAAAAAAADDVDDADDADDTDNDARAPAPTAPLYVSTAPSLLPSVDSEGSGEEPASVSSQQPAASSTQATASRDGGDGAYQRDGGSDPPVNSLLQMGVGREVATALSVGGRSDAVVTAQHAVARAERSQQKNSEAQELSAQFERERLDAIRKAQLRKAMLLKQQELDAAETAEEEAKRQQDIATEHRKRQDQKQSKVAARTQHQPEASGTSSVDVGQALPSSATASPLMHRGTAVAAAADRPPAPLHGTAPQAAAGGGGSGGSSVGEAVQRPALDQSTANVVEDARAANIVLQDAERRARRVHAAQNTRLDLDLAYLRKPSFGEGPCLEASVSFGAGDSRPLVCFAGPGYPARVKARVQTDAVYRQDAIQWETRRTELETSLASSFPCHSETDAAALKDRVARLAEWMHLMHDDDFREASCALWVDYAVLDAAWDVYAAEYGQYRVWHIHSAHQEDVGVPAVATSQRTQRTKDTVFGRMMDSLEAGIASDRVPQQSGTGTNLPEGQSNDPPITKEASLAAAALAQAQKREVQARQEAEHSTTSTHRMKSRGEAVLRAAGEGVDSTVTRKADAEQRIQQMWEEEERRVDADFSRRRATVEPQRKHHSNLQAAGAPPAHVTAREASRASDAGEKASSSATADERRGKSQGLAAQNRSKTDDHSQAKARGTQVQASGGLAEDSVGVKFKGGGDDAVGDGDGAGAKRRRPPLTTAQHSLPTKASPASAASTTSSTRLVPSDDGIRVYGLDTDSHGPALAAQQEQRVAEVSTLSALVYPCELVCVADTHLWLQFRQGEADKEMLAAQKQALVSRLERTLAQKVKGKSFAAALCAFGIQVVDDATTAELQKARKKALVKFHPDRAIQRGEPWEKIVEAEEIYKLLQNLHEQQGQSDSDIMQQYRTRKQQQAAASAAGYQSATRRAAEQREHQQARDAAAKLREQMRRMERHATHRAESERKEARGSGSQNSALRTLAVLAADRELRELQTRYGEWLAGPTITVAAFGMHLGHPVAPNDSLLGYCY